MSQNKSEDCAYPNMTFSEFNKIVKDDYEESTDRRVFSEDDFDLPDIPDEVKKKFEGVCGSRWISFLRQARKLIYRLNIEAPQAMINFVQKTLKMSNADMGVLC